MIHGHIDGMIEAMDQVVEGIALAAYAPGAALGDAVDAIARVSADIHLPATIMRRLT